MKTLLVALFLMVGVLGFTRETKLFNFISDEVAIYNWNTTEFYNISNDASFNIPLITSISGITVLKNSNMEIQITILPGDGIRFWVISSPMLGYDVAVWIEYLD